MKTRTTKPLIAILISITCFAAAHGQSRRIATASIPFEFQVGDSRLPAGRYIIEQRGSLSDVSTLIVRDEKYSTEASTLLSVDDLTGRRLPDLPTLIFADLGQTKMLAYFSDPDINYIGRAGASKWRGKKVWTRGARIEAISLKPIVASK